MANFDVIFIMDRLAKSFAHVDYRSTSEKFISMGDVRDRPNKVNSKVFVAQAKKAIKKGYKVYLARVIGT